MLKNEWENYIQFASVCWEHMRERAEVKLKEYSQTGLPDTNKKKEVNKSWNGKESEGNVAFEMYRKQADGTLVSFICFIVWLLFVIVLIAWNK